MEGNVWTQLFAVVVDVVSSLLRSSDNPLIQKSGGASPDAQKTPADSTSTSNPVKTPTLAKPSLLQLKRNPEMTTTDGRFGDMVCSGERVCFTMENKALSIPAGLYGLEIYDSPHAGHPVPRLQNVFGRSEIEIHCGNIPEDSKGCIIVGLDHKGDTLERSRDAFSIVFPKIQAALAEGPQTIEVLES